MPVIQNVKIFALTAEGEKNIRTDLLNLRLTNPKIRRLSLKEVIQPHLPIGLPCYDFIPVIGLTLGTSLLAVGSVTSGKTNSHDVTGGVYKARERIHGVVADTPLLAIPTSCSRVADYNPNWDRLSGFALPCGFAAFCTGHCSTCVAPDIRAMRT
jgi:hypothetical protein